MDPETKRALRDEILSCEADDSATSSSKKPRKTSPTSSKNVVCESSERIPDPKQSALVKEDGVEPQKKPMLDHEGYAAEEKRAKHETGIADEGICVEDEGKCIEEQKRTDLKLDERSAFAGELDEMEDEYSLEEREGYFANDPFLGCDCGNDSSEDDSETDSLYEAMLEFIYS